ncbi:hypothetical protein MBLNU230_g7095t1 [Neophaeotheca triangularis]
MEIKERQRARKRQETARHERARADAELKPRQQQRFSEYGVRKKQEIARYERARADAEPKPRQQQRLTEHGSTTNSVATTSKTQNKSTFDRTQWPVKYQSLPFLDKAELERCQRERRCHRSREPGHSFFEMPARADRENSPAQYSPMPPGAYEYPEVEGYEEKAHSASRRNQRSPFSELSSQFPVRNRPSQAQPLRDPPIRKYAGRVKDLLPTEARDALNNWFVKGKRNWLQNRQNKAAMRSRILQRSRPLQRAAKRQESPELGTPLARRFPACNARTRLVRPVRQDETPLQRRRARRAEHLRLAREEKERVMEKYLARRQRAMEMWDVAQRAAGVGHSDG